MPIDKFADLDPLLLNAHRALLGSVDAPELAISALLRSDLEMTTAFRSKLADALEGKKGTIGLRAAGLSNTKLERSLKRHIAGLERGRIAAALMLEGLKYEDAIEQIAYESGFSTKTIVNNVARARECETWIDEQKDKSNAIRNEAVLRDIFVHSLVRNDDPNAMLQQLIDEVTRELNRSADTLGWNAVPKPEQ